MSCKEIYGPYPKAIWEPSITNDSSVDDEKKSEDLYCKPQSKDEANTEASKQPDYRDIGTPDEWIVRDGSMVRLTGRHPFNSEPPLSILDKYRFLTPVNVSIVRNHGAVPRLSWDTHLLDVGGPLLPETMSISMDELSSMRPTRELPVTISCCGNRRKEINMIKQSIGFSWGAAGVATNVYKGVLLRDLLLRAGLKTNEDVEGKFVEFVGYEDLPNKIGRGPFKDEPWGRLVKYGTSIPLARAMNPAFDVLIAYEANGERLHPDHGFPVRVVIPGYIGGRMVKWLKQVNVIPHESKNHFHYHDNKYLPPQITAEEALHNGWWYKQEYIINDLSLNSVITQPDHNVTLSIREAIEDKFEIGGYAHTGGGRMITRVQITFDGGETWNVCKVDRKERPNPYGMYWCWIWWSYSVEVANLLDCKEIWCRAWDGANNPQPIEPTWTLMGQNANHVFRVKIHVDRTSSGECVLCFEHPTQPGQQTGGWATRVADKFPSAGFGKISYGPRGEILEDH